LARQRDSGYWFRLGILAGVPAVEVKKLGQSDWTKGVEFKRKRKRILVECDI
jgi:hypothetical protein